MAVFHPYTVQCACGAAVTAQLADSINVRRSPEARERIMRGELHRAACAACGRQMTVEKAFYYTDFDRNALFKVFPKGERHGWKKASEDLDEASSYIPSGVAATEERTLRVVYGMDELREKLVAQDAGIDDRLLEIIKVLLVYEHPILLKWSRLRLVLQEVTETELRFHASYEHSQQVFRVDMPRRLLDEIQSDHKRIEEWTSKAHKTSIFALPDHWVNMWRWSPQPTALDRLQTYAAKINAGETIDTTSSTFKQMIAGLPRGRHLPPWAKRDLHIVFLYAKEKDLQDLQDDLFEIRFDIELEDDWSQNADPHDIDTLWDLLKDLPDTNVEGNTKIREIQLGIGESGGFYQPGTNDISIGSEMLTHREAFEDVVRHEVGHAVHEMRTPLIDGWLAERFGWQTFGRTDSEIDRWVELMGGWGDLTSRQRRDVRDALRTALGHGSSWQPGPTPTLTPGHPWYDADFGPRLAFERTGANWYSNHNVWYRAGGKAFFLNYWYRTFVAVSEETLDLVSRMPDPYAAMSHYEFFAELYALHYDVEDDRTAIPDDVAQWLDANIGAPEPGAPMVSLTRPAPPREWETVTRPGIPRDAASDQTA